MVINTSVCTVRKGKHIGPAVYGALQTLCGLHSEWTDGSPSTGLAQRVPLPLALSVLKPARKGWEGHSPI